MPMLPIPDTVRTRFDAVLDKRAVATALRADYKKWLRYFLDYCGGNVKNIRPHIVWFEAQQGKRAEIRVGAEERCLIS